MTNADKYEEVFGFPPNRYACMYDDHKDCKGCPIVCEDNSALERLKWWNSEYKESEQEMIDLDKEIELYKSKVAFYESQNTRGEYAVTVRELKYVVEILEALCSVRPQGEWIKSTEHMRGTITTIYKCSECGRTIATMPNKLDEYPFCHCGARMR